MAGRRLQRIQSGAALLIFLILLVTAALTYVVNSLTPEMIEARRTQKTSAALVQARDALIGYSVKETPVLDAGYLLVPDTGWTSTPEGNSEGTLGAMNVSVMGKLPWKTLGVPPLRDGEGECLWYVVSGRFKINPKTTEAFNWDTLGQIDIIDNNGNLLANNVAALIAAPGAVRDAQDRAIADPSLIHCGGNYGARNYLDPYNSSDALSGQINYFAGSLVAPDTSNKQFVQANNDHYNDRFLLITVDAIFRPIIRRNDFASLISSLLINTGFESHLQVTPIIGAKGTDHIDCNQAPNPGFCNNWKEMLFLTELPTPSSITIDALPSPVCTRVLIFSGQKTAWQTRVTVGDKANKGNYLEDPNFSHFSTPIALEVDFIGRSSFDANNPSADVIKCIPP